MALFAVHNEGTFQVGDLVRVHIQSPSARRRESIFEGYVLGIRGVAENKSLLVRRIGAGGVGIERIFPLSSPLITQIEVKQKLGAGTRRAKLYFLRESPKSSYDKIPRRTGKKGKGPIVKGSVSRPGSGRKKKKVVKRR